MTIIQSVRDFDVRVLFNSPLSYFLSVANPKISDRICRSQKQTLSLKQTESHPLTSLRFVNHDVAIRTQYFREWQLLSICFLISILSYFALNPLFLFYARFNWGDSVEISSSQASLIYVCYYGSCVVSLVFWMFLVRLEMWNMGIFANINEFHHQRQASSSSNPPDLDANTRMQIVNFKRNSYESRINGYLICLRWLLFGWTISVCLIAASQTYYQCIIAVCVSGVFYPNLLITSASILVYAIDQLQAVQYAYNFITGCIVMGWILMPLLTAVIAEYINYWTPFLLIGLCLSCYILVIMCCEPTKRTQAQIYSTMPTAEDTNDVNIDTDLQQDEETIPLKTKSSDPDVAKSNAAGTGPQTNNHRQTSISDGIFSDSSMTFQRGMTDGFDPAEDSMDEYKKIQRDAETSVWSMVGCETMCRYNSKLMSSSIGMFQVTAFLLNVESFLTNLCMALYLTWYCMAMHDDLEQGFVVSTLQMSVTGIVVLVCVVLISRYAFQTFYYYSFRIWINMCCIVVSVIMATYYLTAYVYWFVMPIMISLLVLLDVSTNLIINSNAPNGCYTFINGSNQIFQLTAFLVAPLLMGLFVTFENGHNMYTFWRIISTVLAVQLSVTILVAFIQGFVHCFCKKDRYVGHRQHAQGAQQQQPKTADIRGTDEEELFS